MKKIKVGIVGLGRLGFKHAENLAFRVPYCELIAVCSATKKKVASVKKQLSVPYGYTDFDEMLANKELDAIFISSPSGYHCEQIIRALEAGFHVFSEKPLGMNVEETERVAETVAKHEFQVFMLGFMRRYEKSYAAAKKKIAEGKIGEPVLIRCYGLDPANDLDSFLTYASNNDSGGIFLDMAVHDFDIARWYMGSEAKEVWAIGGAYGHPKFDEIKDAETATVMVRFENNAMGMFVVSRNCAHGYHIETEIIGTKGSIRIGTFPQKDQIVSFNEQGAVTEIVEGFLERFEQAFLSEAEEFVQCILENRKPDITVRDGIESTKLAHASKTSFEKGDLVQV